MCFCERIISYAPINGRLIVLAGVQPVSNQPRATRRVAVMHPDTSKYNKSLGSHDRDICNLLAREIDQALPEAENKYGTPTRCGFWMATPLSGIAS